MSKPFGKEAMKTTSLTSTCLVVLGLALAGCSTASAPHPIDHTLVSMSQPKTVYVSDMMFNIDLTDPATGLPIHATMEQIEPIVAREAERIVYEPLLRTVLNQPAVQQTKWFQAFKNDFDEAYLSLRDLVFVESIEKTSLIKVYLVAPNPDDAQIILTAIQNEYFRQNQHLEQALSGRNMESAQRQLNEAEEEVTSIKATIKRFLEVTQDAKPEEQKARSIELASLIRKQKAAETRYQRARTRITDALAFDKRGGSLRGYTISVEYRPQKAHPEVNDD